MYKARERAKTPDKIKKIQITIRVDQEEADELFDEATEKNLTMSDLIRRKLKRRRR